MSRVVLSRLDCVDSANWNGAQRAVKHVSVIDGPGNEIAKTEKSGDGRVYRVPVEILRGVELLQDAMVQDGHLIGNAEGLGLVMGDKNGGYLSGISGLSGFRRSIGP